MRKINIKRNVHMISDQINADRTVKESMRFKSTLTTEAKISFSNRIIAMKKLSDYFLYKRPEIPKESKFDSVYKNIINLSFINN